MSEIQLRPPTLDDVDELLAFELANRAFFERWINARAPAFYQPDAVADSILALQQGAAGDHGYAFLILHQDAIVGRINLTAVERPYFNRATLGYRLAEHLRARLGVSSGRPTAAAGVRAAGLVAAGSARGPAQPGLARGAAAQRLCPVWPQRAVVLPARAMARHVAPGLPGTRCTQVGRNACRGCAITR